MPRCFQQRTQTFHENGINNGGAFIVGAIMIFCGGMTLGTLIALILLLEEVTNTFRRSGALWANLQFSL